MIASLPAKEGFGFEHPPLPSIAGPSKKPSPSVASSSKDRDAGKGKRRKTPEYTDSEDESSYESMDEDAVKELLRPAKKHLVRHQIVLFRVNILLIYIVRRKSLNLGRRISVGRRRSLLLKNAWRVLVHVSMRWWQKRRRKGRMLRSGESIAGCKSSVFLFPGQI